MPYKIITDGEDEALFKRKAKKISDLLLLSNERVLFENFSRYKDEYNNSFSLYIEGVQILGWKPLYVQFPVTEFTFQKEKTKLKNFLNEIVNAFQEDKEELIKNKLIRDSPIKDIEVGAGDTHKGKATAIISLENGQKLIYKPTEAKISSAYYQFMDWLGKSYPLGEYRYKIINKETYHWQEFVVNKTCTDLAELKKYYNRAGAVLAVTYLLNAADFHFENLIAYCSTPVLIDHETIVQAKMAKRLQDFFEAAHKHRELKEADSVAMSFLLPIKHSDLTGLPAGSCGFGWNKETKIQGLEKQSINRFQDDWKMVTRFVTHSLIKNNLPLLNGNPVHINEYMEDFIQGFEEVYRLLLSQREFLQHDPDSPLNAFRDCTVRFIWRPTNIYAKIQKQMKLPKNLKDIDHYRKKIENYMAVAYKNVPADSDLQLLYKSEVAQMLRGDIPIFEMDTESHDLKTEFGTVKNVFDLSCMENLERKIHKLSEEDLMLQKEIIREAYA